MEKGDFTSVECILNLGYNELLCKDVIYLEVKATIKYNQNEHNLNYYIKAKKNIVVYVICTNLLTHKKKKKHLTFLTLVGASASPCFSFLRHFRRDPVWRESRESEQLARTETHKLMNTLLLYYIR